MKVLTVFGTRPEAIKLAPVLHRLQELAPDVQSVVVVTGQHREMLDQVLRTFDIRPDEDLHVMLPGQDLFDISVQTLSALRPVLLRHRPDVLLVQGDTTSAFCAALAAYYCHVPVGHVEAGLRTFDKRDPFPEEVNRTLIDVVADHHFAPTVRARDNLLAQGVSAGTIHVTGNTVVDAIRTILARPAPPLPPALRSIDWGRQRVILLTAHRRESFGAPMRSVFAAIRDVLARTPDVVVVFPVHLNPNVRAAVRDALGEHERLVLTEPLPYEEFAHLMHRAYLIVTDSGGIQEEASAIGTPVVVVRDKTERGESVEGGLSVLVGRERGAVLAAVERLLHDPSAHRAMARADCPYGDGRAALRIVDLLRAAHGAGR